MINRFSTLQERLRKPTMFNILRNFCKKKIVQSDLSTSFMASNIPTAQRVLVDEQLHQMYLDNPPQHFSALADIFKTIPDYREITIFDAGCASGYYYEILQHLCQFKGLYLGADFSAAMLAMAATLHAQINFFETDIRALSFRRMSFPVVLSGAVLVHVKEWQQAVSELCRIAEKYLILHRTVVTTNIETPIRVMKSYGTPTYQVYIAEIELIKLLDTLGFVLLKKVDSGEGFDQQEIRNFSYIFQRTGA